MTKSASNLGQYSIGDRIECEGYFGTIKYIGPVDGKPSVWLGIDWDDPKRGKHNGVVNNVSYFTTRNETSGSFLRPEKVKIGRPASEAINSRYGQPEDEITVQMNRQNQLKLQQSMNAPFLEMVGFDRIFDKQRNFESLRVANLRHENVSYAGNLRSLCPNIMELDLSKNLMKSWLDVFDICSQLPHLRWLNVSENLLSFPENYDQFHFPDLEVLICGRMNLNCDQIIKITTVFPNLEELRCPFNDITKLDTLQNCEHLKIIDLEGNPIKKWSEVLKLDSASNLEYLILENIGLEKIYFEEKERTNKFRNLQKLCLGRNLISEWESVGELNKLEKLEYLKIFGNPIIESESLGTAIQLITAKIRTLKSVNGVNIDPSERRGAEYDYIRKYGLEWLSVKGTEKEEQFLKSHNRYLELLEKYGEPELSELETKERIIKHSLADLRFTYALITIRKKVPLSITVQKLKILVQKLFKLKERPHLVCRSTQFSNIEIDLDDDLREISLYSVQDNDEIFIKM